MVIQRDLTKRQHLSAHFGLKYLSNDGINREIVFIVKIFQKYTLLGQLKEPRANFEWSVPLNKKNYDSSMRMLKTLLFGIA